MTAMFQMCTTDLVNLSILSAHELERVQEIFKAKQKELVFAAAKVDNLTQQLDGRRMGLSSARATPERLNTEATMHK